MAKELPYFRFTVAEWQNGDITLESYETQGVFINACSYYWISNCILTEKKLKARLRDAEATLTKLIEMGIIKITNDGFVRINFLDDQWEILQDKTAALSKAGKKGYLAKVRKAQARLKGGLSYNDKDNDNKSPGLSQAENRSGDPEQDAIMDQRIKNAKKGIYD